MRPTEGGTGMANLAGKRDGRFDAGVTDGGRGTRHDAPMQAMPRNPPGQPRACGSGGQSEQRIHDPPIRSSSCGCHEPGSSQRRRRCALARPARLPIRAPAMPSRHLRHLPEQLPARRPESAATSPVARLGAPPAPAARIANCVPLTRPRMRPCSEFRCSVRPRRLRGCPHLPSGSHIRATRQAHLPFQRWPGSWAFSRSPVLHCRRCHRMPASRARARTRTGRYRVGSAGRRDCGAIPPRPGATGSDGYRDDLGA